MNESVVSWIGASDALPESFLKGFHDVGDEEIAEAFYVSSWFVLHWFKP